jgi:hypothetical protein
MAYKDNEIDISDLKVPKAPTSRCWRLAAGHPRRTMPARVTTPSASAWICPVCANTGPPSYEHVTFNHGVEGSSPSALTNKINDLR